MFNKVEALLLLFPLLVLFPLLFLEIEVEEIVDCKLRVKELLKEFEFEEFEARFELSDLPKCKATISAFSVIIFMLSFEKSSNCNFKSSICLSRSFSSYKLLKLNCLSSCVHLVMSKTFK